MDKFGSGIGFFLKSFVKQTTSKAEDCLSRRRVPQAVVWLD